MKSRRHVNFAIKQLYHIIERDIDDRLSEKSELTKAQGGIIHFIMNSDRDIFQKDIEEEFKIRRSTVSVLLSSMEKNGYIRRETVTSDARLRKIVPTEKALSNHRKLHGFFEKYDEELREGISEEELDLFFDVIDKIRHNIEKKERKD